MTLAVDLDLFIGHAIAGALAGVINYMYSGRNPWRVIFMGILVAMLFVMPAQVRRILFGHGEPVDLLVALARWFDFVIFASLTTYYLVRRERRKVDRLSFGPD